jgi:hypothetical protein
MSDMRVNSFSVAELTAIVRELGRNLGGNDVAPSGRRLGLRRGCGATIAAASDHTGPGLNNVPIAFRR